MREQIKVGFCVAYDWHLLEYSVPLIYPYADRIFISLDKDRISWNVNKYEFDSTAFYNLIRKLDSDNKITLVEEDYHLSDLSPGQNEVRQRNLLAAHMGSGGWHIQLDCDEYMVDFKGFVNYLWSIPLSRTDTFNVSCPMITLYKKVEGGMLYVTAGEEKNIEYFNIATRKPFYEYGRVNGYFNIYTNFRILHQSYAREAGEIEAKITNWGHARDLDSKAYIEKWKNLTAENYHLAKNLHPLKPEIWPSLRFVEGNIPADMIPYFRQSAEFTKSRLTLAFINNKNVSRIRSLCRKIVQIGTR